MVKKKFDSPQARLNRAKGQKGKGLFRSPGGETHKTKTKIVVVRLDGAIAAAVRRATPPRIDVPGAATNHSILTITSIYPSTSINRGSIIIIMPNILTPFVYIPMHII